MQTFLPYPSIYDSTKCLDKRRQFKQVVEAGQILDALKIRKEGTPRTPGVQRIISHPASMAFYGYEDALTEYYNIFWQYAVDVHKVKMKKMGLRKVSSQKIEWPKWWAFPAYHANHRARLLEKKPEHYSQFGWTELPTMVNYYPVDKNGLKPEILEWYDKIQKSDYDK